MLVCFCSGACARGACAGISVRMVSQSNLIPCQDVPVFADAVRLPDTEQTPKDGQGRRGWKACSRDGSFCELGDRGLQYVESLGHLLKPESPKKSRRPLNAAGSPNLLESPFFQSRLALARRVVKCRSPFPQLSKAPKPYTKPDLSPCSLKAETQTSNSKP